MADPALGRDPTPGIAVTTGRDARPGSAGRRGHSIKRLGSPRT